MRIIIRKNVFETNSSSMHSLVIAKHPMSYDKKEILEHIWIQKDGAWHPSDWNMEFGRAPFDVLTGFPEKTLYAIAEFCSYKSGNEAAEEFSQIKKIVTNFIPKIRDIILPMRPETVYYDDCGNILSYDQLKWHNDTYYYENSKGKKKKPKTELVSKPYYGDIDHQSAGMLKSFLEQRNISLKEFLTNPKYWIIIDGDEYDTWDHLKKSGVIDLANIEYDSSEDDSDKRPLSHEEQSYIDWKKEHPDE